MTVSTVLTRLSRRRRVPGMHPLQPATSCAKRGFIGTDQFIEERRQRIKHRQRRVNGAWVRAAS